MALKAGIVGLPNVGKSTLFNAITNSKIEAANYPFATIEPNVGIVQLEDERLDFLAEHFKTKSKVSNQFTFIDIAGLVKGASKGEGLGNKFLANIREVDIIVQVVRCFENKEIIHVEDSIDPVRDMETINLELIFADLEIAEKRIAKIEKKAEVTKDKYIVQEVNYLKEIIENLNNGVLVKDIQSFDQHMFAYAKSIGLISSKKIIYVANIAEDDVLDYKNNKFYNELKGAIKENDELIPISARIEFEISEIDNAEDKAMFMDEMNLNESGLSTITKVVMKALGIGNFFTAGVEEVRAWSFKYGDPVKESAGVIHTDISRGFISADVYKVDDLMRLGSVEEVKANGLFKAEGKTYNLQEGDVCFFKFNV